MRALVIDARDSFVHIIYQYLRMLDVAAHVVRNDKVSIEAIHLYRPDFILLGPGPGHPADSGYVNIVREFAGNIPMLGICLGHQAIGLAFGGKVERASHLMHGKTSQIVHDKTGCFSGQPNPLRATRYHSLIVSEADLPESLIVSAHANDDGYIMGLRHRTKPIESVQFHPESVNTENGIAFFENFINTYVCKQQSRQPIFYGESRYEPATAA